MSILGNRVTRSEDPRFITGTATFGDDVPAQGALHATFVRSILPHGRITGIDTSAVAEIPGAIAFTGADVEVEARPVPMPGSRRDAAARHRAGRRALRGRDRRDRPHGGARAGPGRDRAGHRRHGRAAGRRRRAHGPGGRGAAVPRRRHERLRALPEGGSRPRAVRRLRGRRHDELPQPAARLVPDGVPRRRRRVGRGRPPDPLGDVADAPRHARRPRRRARDRAEQDPGPRAGRRRRLRPEGRRRARGHPRRLARAEGRPARALDRDAHREHARARPRPRPAPGAHARRRPRRHAQGVPHGDRAGLGRIPRGRGDPPDAHEDVRLGPYAIPRIEADAVSVVTNTTPITAYRGAGRPEATQAIERAIDVFAAEAGLDPAEVRRRNLIPADAFPYTTASGARLRQRRLRPRARPAARERGLPRAARRAGARRAARRPRQMGIGLCVYIEITNGFAEPEWGGVRSPPTGGATVRTGLGPTGQGHQTALAMLVATASACRSTRSRSTTATPTSSRAAPAPTARARCRPAARRSAARRSRSPSRARSSPRRSSRRARRTSSSTPTAASSTSPASRPGPSRGRARGLARRRRAPGGARDRGGLQAGVADLAVRRPPRRGRGRHRDRQGPARADRRASTTAGRSSTRCSSTASATAASPRASRRR